MRASRQTDRRRSLLLSRTSSSTRNARTSRRNTYALLRASSRSLSFCRVIKPLSLSVCLSFSPSLSFTLAVTLTLFPLATLTSSSARSVSRTSFSTLSLSLSLPRVTSRSCFPSCALPSSVLPLASANGSAVTVPLSPTHIHVLSLSLSVSVNYHAPRAPVTAPCPRAYRNCSYAWLARSLVRTAASSVSLTRRQTNVGVSRHDGCIVRAHGRTRHGTARHGTTRHGHATLAENRKGRARIR